MTIVKYEDIQKVLADVKEIKKNPDLGALIFIDLKDGMIWADALMLGESRSYKSESINKIDWDTYYYDTCDINAAEPVKLAYHLAKRYDVKIED